MKTHRTIIDSWPDMEAFARDIGASINTAKAIRQRGWIPDWYWWRVVRAAERRDLKGVSFETLAKLAKERAP